MIKRGFQAAVRLCTRRSPYIAECAEEITTDIFFTIRGAALSDKTAKKAASLCRNSIHRTSTSSSSSRSWQLATRSWQLGSSDPFPKVIRASRFYSTGTRFGRDGFRSWQLATRSWQLGSSDPFPKVIRASRFYSTGTRFGRDGFRGRQWSTRQYVLIAVATTGLCVSIYFSHREVVPYTYRHHFVLIPPDYEIRMVQSQFQALKEEWKDLLLPPYHPEAIRVRRIAKDIITAVLEGIQLEEIDGSQLEHGGKIRTPKGGGTGVLVWRENLKFPVSAQWGNKEEVLDDQWMDETRKKGLKKGSKPFVEHLKKLKWEVLIVDKDIVNAFCLPGGKIVVFTGLLKRFPTDEQIATVLGHEVAHVVARHSAERMTRHLYLTLVQLFLLAFLNAPDIVQSVSILILELPFSRRQELEADHVGLLLMAAAGYDPRVAPLVYEKLGELGGTTAELLQYVTTHPSGKKRGQKLRSAGTMEQALRIYAERTQGTVVEGFLRRN